MKQSIENAGSPSKALPEIIDLGSASTMTQGGLGPTEGVAGPGQSGAPGIADE